MSIIHEALKKTGHITPVGHKKTSTGWRFFLVLGIVLVIAAPLFAGRVLNRTQTGAESSTALGQFGIEEAPVAPAPFVMRSPWSADGIPFVLSGVVYSGKDSYCLINGLVLKEGQKVGNATVEKITSNAVTLDVNGRKSILSAAATS